MGAPKYHPLSKTALELRRGIQRLEGWRDGRPNEFQEAEGWSILEALKQAKALIPDEYSDEDPR